MIAAEDPARDKKGRFGSPSDLGEMIRSAAEPQPERFWGARTFNGVTDPMLKQGPALRVLQMYRRR